MVKNKIIKNIFSPNEKLIKYLIEHKSPSSIKSVSEGISMDYKNTHAIVSGLMPDLILNEKIGNTNLIQIKLVSHPVIYAVEKKRTEEFLSNHLQLRIVKRYIEELNYPFLIVLVFGSYVKKIQTKSSDIDICVILDDKIKSKELWQKLNLLPLKLEIHEFNTKEFILMIEKKQNNVGQEIVKNNIILYGIENYYNLISKWMKKE